MTFLDNKVPPPIVGAVFAVVMWGASYLVPAAAFTMPYRYVFCALAVALGVTISVTALLSFRRSQTTINPLDPNEAEALVTSGIFGISRNPMYVGLTLVLLAWAVFLQNSMAFITLPLFVIYITVFQIRPEEHALAQKFDAAFESYRTSVRRWL
jgi:protein-S-isoprenylcysteine O-methyltransferase Ste14